MGKIWWHFCTYNLDKERPVCNKFGQDGTGLMLPALTQNYHTNTPREWISFGPDFLRQLPPFPDNKWLQKHIGVLPKSPPSISWVTRVWGSSRIPRISKFSQISRKCTFLKKTFSKRPLFPIPIHGTLWPMDFGERAEYCFESTVSEKRTHWVLRQTRWVLRETRWVRVCTQIIGRKELTEFGPRNSVSPKKLTEFGVWNRAPRNRIRPISGISGPLHVFRQNVWQCVRKTERSCSPYISGKERHVKDVRVRRAGVLGS